MQGFPSTLGRVNALVTLWFLVWDLKKSASQPRPRDDRVGPRYCRGLKSCQYCDPNVPCMAVVFKKNQIDLTTIVMIIVASLLQKQNTAMQEPCLQSQWATLADHGVPSTGHFEAKEACCFGPLGFLDLLYT